MRQGLVLLSDQDADAPELPAVCTVSKDEAWDDGGYQIGLEACQQGAMWVDRPFFTGNPSVDWLVVHADRVTATGAYCQLGNELNLVLEGWSGGPTAWLVYQQEVRSRAQHPERLLAMPPSPGIPGWQAWVDPVGPHSIHAYGSLEQMQSVVRWYVTNTSGELYVTECNFGAGNEVAVDRWAEDHFRPFLDWLATEPRVRFCSYFAWRWRGAPPMPTPVDAAGTRVAAVLRAWTPPQPAPEVRPMEKRAYLWQFDQLGETSIPEIAATLRLGGVAEIACKTHQGTSWLGRAADGDTSPLAFRSTADVQARYLDFRAEGIRMVPLCVPKVVHAATEAALAVEVARACEGVIELDLEPYENFWTGPYEELTAYTEAITDRGGRYEVNFDARAGGWQPFGAAPFALCCARAEAVWTQSYWTDFGRDAEAVVSDALATLALLEVPPEKAGIIYPWDGAEDYERVTRRLQERAPLVQKIGMWRMGTAGPAVYEALAAIPTAPTSDPSTPTDSHFDVDAARDRLWTEAEALEQNGWPWFASGVKAAVAQSKGDR